MNAEFWIGFVPALLALLGVVFVLARLNLLPTMHAKDTSMTRIQLEQKVAELETTARDLAATVKVLQGDHVRDVQRIAQLERENGEIKNELALAKKELALVRAQLAARAVVVSGAGPDFPLLAVFGQAEHDVDQITVNDETALNQTGIPYRAIYNATRELVAAELNRRRVNDDLYRWLHLAGHGGNLGNGNAGALLADGVADREWWNKQLAGIEGVFLAGCTEVAVADWLVGVVRWVVSFSRDVGNEEVRQFGLVFWSTLADNKHTPREAYRAACKAVQGLAKFSDFRQREV